MNAGGPGGAPQEDSMEIPAPPPVVLVVDDDPAVCRMLEAQLAGWGYAVRIAEGGVAGVDLARFIMSNLGTFGKYAERLTDFIQVMDAALAGADPALAGEVARQRKALKVDFILGDIHRMVAESLEGTDRIRRIVQDLKNFSRLDTAGHQPADLNAVLDSTLNIIWNELKYTVTLKKDYGTLPPTRCNAGQLAQVFMNILVNAAHAIETQGEIAIVTREEAGGWIRVSISDSGCGIPEEKRAKIFEPFFTTKEVGKGTGLGLSIALDIVKKHGGGIGIESAVGQGTTFEIRIPVVE